MFQVLNIKVISHAKGHLPQTTKQPRKCAKYEIKCVDAKRSIQLLWMATEKRKERTRQMNESGMHLMHFARL